MITTCLICNVATMSWFKQLFFPRFDDVKTIKKQQQKCAYCIDTAMQTEKESM